MKEDGKQNWFRKHWIISIILGVLVLGMVGNTFNSPTGNITNSQENKITNNYIDEDIYDLWTKFISKSSVLTDLQKEEDFKSYKNNFIKSGGIISKIDEVGFGSDDIVVGIESPENPYLRAGTLYFDNSYKNQLMNYNLGDEINFEGKIDNYNSLLGIIIKESQLK